MPIYAMQSAKLSNDLFNKLDKLNRDFLCGDSNEKRVVHLVNWGTVCLPKYRGGLGIKKMKFMNQALITKAGWRLLHNKDGLWGKLLEQKYFKNSFLTDSVNSQTGVNSSTLRSIFFGAKILSKGLV
ncbi:hypothetical protein ACOSQ4_028971 [Xanthoceras sorbifolium]